MKYLKESWKINLGTNQNYYKIDWFNLNLFHYNKTKIDNGYINCLKKEMNFTKYDSIYDIAMTCFCELGYVDINHEKFIKHIEFLYNRDLYHYELVDYVQKTFEVMGLIN